MSCLIWNHPSQVEQRLRRGAIEVDYSGMTAAVKETDRVLGTQSEFSDLEYVLTLSEASSIPLDKVSYIYQSAVKVAEERIVAWLMDQVNQRKPSVPQPDAPFMYHYFLAAADAIKEGRHHAK